MKFDVIVITGSLGEYIDDPYTPAVTYEEKTQTTVNKQGGKNNAK